MEEPAYRKVTLKGPDQASIRDELGVRTCWTFRQNKERKSKNKSCVLVSYSIHQAFMAHIVWYTENMEEKNSLVLFRDSIGAKICNLVKMLILGVFDFMQRCADRSVADLKQCMPVRKFVRLEPVPMPRHCHVWHQSTTRAFREQPAHSAGAVSPERLRERWWRHSCFTIGQTHHMTTMTCVSNIFSSNTAHKSYFTWKISHSCEKNGLKLSQTFNIL